MVQEGAGPGGAAWMMSCEWLYSRRYSGERRVLITDGIRQPETFGPEPEVCS